MFCQQTLFVVEFRDATRVGWEVGEEEGRGQIELYCTIPTELNLHTLKCSHLVRLVSWIVLGPCTSRQNGFGGVVTEQAEELPIV